MRKIKKIMHPLLVILLLFSSCEERYEFVPKGGDSFVVIEGILTNDYKRQEIKISWSESGTDQRAEGISTAKVYVSDGTNAYHFTAVADTPGLYKSDTEFAATIDKQFSLWAEVEGNLYTATDKAIPVTIPDTLRWEYVEEKDKYRLSYVAPVFSPDESAMYIIDLDWSHLPQYNNMPYDSTHARVYYFTLQTVDVNELFQPDKEIVYFPQGTKITETKYSLSPFFALYIRAMLIETQWSGSLFDTEHWNLPTNIKGGALGFFTASSVVRRYYTVQQ